jgi:hypothetical protein
MTRKNTVIEIRGPRSIGPAPKSVYRLNAEAYLAPVFDASVPRRAEMRDVSKLKFIGSSFCSQYQSQAKFYIDEAHASGMRHLVVVYENDEHDFIAGIPDEWADENVQDFIFWPIKNPNSPYPAWEVPARAYGCPMLYAWWKGHPPLQREASARTQK